MTARFFLTRLLQMAATLLLVSLLVYVLIGLMPGDPVDLMISGNPHMTPADAARLRAIYGLDQPLLARYGHWLMGALRGHLGYSRLYNLPVLDVIWPRFCKTALLLGAALFLTVLLAVPQGVAAARKRGTHLDTAINLFCFGGISLPDFWTGLLLTCLFAVKLGWLPAAAALGGAGFLAAAKSLILPVATLTLRNMAVYVRHLRAAMTEALSADHIRTARAKGCSPARVTWHHAFRGALAPVVTIFMLDLGTLFGGAVVVETIFSYPGMGKLLFDAVMGNDFNLALCGFLILAFFVLAANALADVAYALLDPRVTYAGEDA
ncbi:MAG: ABC transporter permease subunit [Alphaproteobacteria bacterium]|nr:ABC transporter permease subunit [Alphaproteobacteria bacterium]